MTTFIAAWTPLLHQPEAPNPELTRPTNEIAELDHAPLQERFADMRRKPASTGSAGIRCNYQ